MTRVPKPAEVRNQPRKSCPAGGEITHPITHPDSTRRWPNSSGPFETDRQVRQTPAVAAVYDAFDAAPGPGRMTPHCHRMLCESLAAAGVELGHVDHRTVLWLSGWGPETCAVICGLIARAAATQGETP